MCIIINHHAIHLSKRGVSGLEREEDSEGEKESLYTTNITKFILWWWAGNFNMYYFFDTITFYLMLRDTKNYYLLQ